MVIFTEQAHRLLKRLSMFGEKRFIEDDKRSNAFYASYSFQYPLSDERNSSYESIRRSSNDFNGPNDNTSAP